MSFIGSVDMVLLVSKLLVVDTLSQLKYFPIKGCILHDTYTPTSKVRSVAFLSLLFIVRIIAIPKLYFEFKRLSYYIHAVENTF